MLSKCCPQTPLSTVASLWWMCPLQKACREMPASMPLDQHSLFLIRIQYAKCLLEYNMQNAWSWWKTAFLCVSWQKTLLGKLGVQEQTGHFSRQLSSQLWHRLNSCKQFPPLLHSFLLTSFLFSLSFPSFLFLSFSLHCFFPLQCSYPDNFKISRLSSKHCAQISY